MYEVRLVLLSSLQQIWELGVLQLEASAFDLMLLRVVQEKATLF